MTELVKRSVTIAGHRTSISLEPLFWEALKQAASEEGRSIAQLVSNVDRARTTNLSSALRLWLFERALQRASGSGAQEASGSGPVSR